MSNNIVKPRRAVSLVELLVVMSACTVILTMSAALVHRMMQTQSRTRSFLDVERSALRLSDQFRQDVHQANAVLARDAELSKDVVLRLQLPDDQTVEYRNLAEGVLRILTRSDAAASREEFAFSRAIDLAIWEEDSPRRLIFSITAQPEETPAGDAQQRLPAYAAPVSLQVEASLGRDSRFVQTTADQEEPE